MSTTDYRWVTHADLENGAFSAIPILDPGSESRRLRWRGALAWYGLHEGNSQSEDLPRAPLDVIVALDDEYASLARSYAKMRSRPLLQFARNIPLSAQLQGLRAKSVLFLGPRRIFTGAFIEEVNRTFMGAWGVITAADLAGTSFVLAKQIGLMQSSLSRKSTLTLDEIDSIARIHTRRRVLETNFDAQVPSVLNEDWQNLILRVHGEGSHANLRSIVLCGRTGLRESGLDGKLLDGCRGSGKNSVCKRVHRRGVLISTFGDLRAGTVCLYSCNGFSVTGELYPSDLSCVVSAAEGIPAALLCNDRPGWADADMLDACAGALIQGHSISDLSLIENDRQQSVDGDRPWVLFGDPIATAVSTTVPQGPAAVHILRAPTESKRIWFAEPQGAVRRLFPGCTHVTVLLRRKLKRNAVRLVDLSDLHEERYTWLVSKRSTAAISGEMEFCLAYLFGSSLAESASFRRGCRRLSAVRRQLSDAISLALRCYERAALTGAWDSQLDILWNLSVTLVKVWDREFATLLIRYMMNGELQALVLDRKKIVVSQACECCARCGRTLTLLKGLDFAANVRGGALRCPLCGPQAAWLEPGPKLSAQVPSVGLKGGTYSIPISIMRPADPLGEGPGFLAITFRDKGIGQNFYERLIELDGSETQIDVHFPANLTSDLHTLRIAWIKSLEFAFLRVRCAAISSCAP